MSVRDAGVQVVQVQQAATQTQEEAGQLSPQVIVKICTRLDNLNYTNNANYNYYFCKIKKEK